MWQYFISELVDLSTVSSVFAEIAYIFFVNSQLIYTRSAQNKKRTVKIRYAYYIWSKMIYIILRA